MGKNVLITKEIVFIIVVLFLGVAIVPSINANVSKLSKDGELVERCSVQQTTDRGYIITDGMESYGIPPVADAGGPYEADENSEVSFDGSGSYDLDGVIVSYEWDFDDGSTGTGVNPTHIYGDNGVYTVILTVTDNLGMTDTDDAPVTVINIAPAIELFGPYTVDEGSPVTINATATDPGSDDLTFTWEFELGPTITNVYYNDGVSPDPYPSPWGTYPFSATDTVEHTYFYNGVYTLALTVEDDDGGITAYTTNITVNPGENQPPYVPSDPNPYDGETDVNLDVELSWTGGDPNPSDTVTYDVYFGTTSPLPLVSEDQIETTYDPPGELDLEETYYWQIVAWDNHGNSSTGDEWEFTTKLNTPPNKPTINGPTRGKVGEQCEYTFKAVDPDGHDIYLWIDWGDDSNTGWIGSYGSGDEVKVKHTWSEKGTYTIKAKAKDVLFDDESDWGTLSVRMPRNRPLTGSLFLRFLERLIECFPLLERILAAIGVI